MLDKEYSLWVFLPIFKFRCALCDISYKIKLEISKTYSLEICRIFLLFHHSHKSVDHILRISPYDWHGKSWYKLCKCYDHLPEFHPKCYSYRMLDIHNNDLHGHSSACLFWWRCMDPKCLDIDLICKTILRNGLNFNNQSYISREFRN